MLKDQENGISVFALPYRAFFSILGLWDRLVTCGPIANRPAWRLTTATQLGKLPHIGVVISRQILTSLFPLSKWTNLVHRVLQYARGSMWSTDRKDAESSIGVRDLQRQIW